MFLHEEISQLGRFRRIGWGKDWDIFSQKFRFTQKSLLIPALSLLFSPVREYPSHYEFPTSSRPALSFSPFQSDPLEKIFSRRNSSYLVQSRLFCHKLLRFQAQFLWGLGGDFWGLERGKNGIFFLEECLSPGGVLGGGRGKQRVVCRRNPP